FERVQFVKKISGGGIEKRSSVRPQTLPRGKKMNEGRNPIDRKEKKISIKGTRGKNGKKMEKPMTEEELNAELESYMKKSEN
ncbi:hypothetical protein PMAYCL1PPCAC_01848, partial [Pristionchus mayeri]